MIKNSSVTSSIFFRPINPLLSGFLTILLTSSVSMQLQASPVDDAISDFQHARLRVGKLKGGILLNTAAAGMNYYFASKGLLAVVEKPEWGDTIEQFLNLYLSQVDPKYGWIADIADYRTKEPSVSDSDDAYTGMMLLLASYYYRTPKGKEWWRKNQVQLKKITNQILLDNMLPSGLTSVYSRHRDFNDLRAYPNLDPDARAFKQQVRYDAYLMDNCESYAGLKALADTLALEKDPEAAVYAQAAAKVATGINSMFDEKHQAFYVLESQKKAFPNFYPKADLVFYPHRAAQAWPQLFQVPLGDSTITQARYDAAWRFLNEGGTEWTNTFPKDGTTGGFPWMSIGYVAALRNERKAAQEQLDWYERTLDKKPPEYPFHYIQEVGYAYRLKQELNK